MQVYAKDMLLASRSLPPAVHLCNCGTASTSGCCQLNYTDNLTSTVVYGSLQTKGPGWGSFTVR